MSRAKLALIALVIACATPAAGDGMGPPVYMWLGPPPSGRCSGPRAVTSEGKDYCCIDNEWSICTVGGGITTPPTPNQLGLVKGTGTSLSCPTGQVSVGFDTSGTLQCATPIGPVDSSTVTYSSLTKTLSDWMAEILSRITALEAALSTYPQQAVEPTFTPAAGNYFATQSVTISTATTGATIYYTTDGSVPTTGSSVYSTPVTVDVNRTLKAIAVKTNLANSTVGTAVYTVTVNTPTFNPIAGSYSTSQSVAISTSTAGATIHYTTDGSTPTTGSTVYSAAIPVSETTTVKALAVKTNLTNSAVATAVYTLPTQVATFTDDFNRANGDLTTPWANTTSTATYMAAIVGNQVVRGNLNVSTQGHAYYNATIAPDQFIQCQLGNRVTGNTAIHVRDGYAGSGTYQGAVQLAYTGAYARLYGNSGSGSTLVAQSSSGWSGDYVRLEITGKSVANGGTGTYVRVMTGATPSSLVQRYYGTHASFDLSQTTGYPSIHITGDGTAWIDNCTIGSTGFGGQMTTAHRTSGEAPLGVFFDAIDTVPAGTPSPFTWTSGVHQPTDGDYEALKYVWDFGDPGSGTWTTTGLSRNTATGYTAAHVYENPGTYTATLTITDKAGSTYSYTQTITVSAFGGTTYYVAANGLDTNPGTEAQPFQTFDKGFAMANAASNRRILFRRGDTFTTGGSSATGELTRAGPGIFGAYGTGNRPIINVTGTTSGIEVVASDWRFMDLDFVGPGSGDAISSPVLVSIDNMTALRVRSSGFGVGFGMGDHTPIFEDPHDGWIFADCEATAALNGMYIGGRRIAVLGNNIHDIGSSHVLRMWEGHKAVISNNRLWSPGPTRHAIKMHSTKVDVPRPETRWVTISDNIIQGKTWSVGIGPQDSGSDERVSHVVIERNRFYSESSIQVDLMIWARQVMVRNNIFDGTGSSAYYTGVNVAPRGIEPPPTDVRVLNNTIVKRDAGTFTGVGNTSAATNLTVRNNLAYAPLASAPKQMETTNTPGAGYVSDHNLLTATPLFTDAASGDYTLQATSPAVAAGLSIPEIREDYARNPRDASPDLGAYERQ